MKRQQTIGFVSEVLQGKKIFIWFVLCSYDSNGNACRSIGATSEDNGRAVQRLTINRRHTSLSWVRERVCVCVAVCLCWDGIHITLFAVVCDTELDWARTFAFRSAINQSMIGTEFTITCTVHKLAIKYIVYRMDIGFLSQLHAVHRRNKYIVTNTRRTKSWPLKKTDFRLFFLCPLQLRARRDVH